MWQTEKLFGKYLMGKLRKEGCDCMRIETGNTITGCPDLWVQVYGDDLFIELKNVHHDLPAECDKAVATEFIPWRPGQQAWAAKYNMYHTTSDKSKHSWTVVGMNDGVIFIRMPREPFEAGIIKYDSPDVFYFSKQQLTEISISVFLIQHTYTGR